MKSLYILGTRGVPAQHGGFETFAEHLSLYLVAHGWKVTVYCQDDGKDNIFNSTWQGVHRIHVPVSGSGAASTILFDWKVARHATHQNGIFLTLGYNTAIFNVLQRIKGQTNLINMDGIEWKRDKWGVIAKTWFWLNERVGAWVGSHLIADHPMIKKHLATRVSHEKITMIPYGGDDITHADPDKLKPYEINPQDFSIIIARPEPENSFLEMVKAFSSKKRNHKLVVLGSFKPNENSFHKAVIDAASNEVIFPGAIYDSSVVQALRCFSRFYFHGHRVGGTNPSLVEALGAGCAVIAHDNHFNRWVAGDAAEYFKDAASCAHIIDLLLDDTEKASSMKSASKQRYYECFTWEKVLEQYENVLSAWYPLNRA